MLLLALTLAAISSEAAAHMTVVEHRGTSYHVAYRPRITTRTKTVGMSAGTRMSTERCRWTVAVRIDRSIRRAHGAIATSARLPGTHTLKGEHPGTCQQAAGAIASALNRAHTHIAQVAGVDRAALLSDIDAAHALAMQ